MATIVFYEKPGCVNNTRQKQLLQGAGHDVVARNLLYAPWTSRRLLDFFRDLPVSEWFNNNAPQIKSGELDPGSLSEGLALCRLLADPILIRRPLLEVRGKKLVGFDVELINRLIGLQDVKFDIDLESCTRA